VRLARAQHIEADTRDHGGEPSAEILDLVGAGATESQPGFLHSVVGFIHRTEHAVGDCPQMTAILLELLG
jgi:hypothetical protein